MSESPRGSTEDRQKTDDQSDVERTLGALGQVVASLAHDLNNRFQAILMQTDLLQQKVGLPPVVSLRSKEIAEQARQGSELLVRILEFSRKWVSDRREVDLTSLVKRFCNSLKGSTSGNIRLVMMPENPGECKVLADAGQIDKMLENLVKNATEAMPDGGELKISLSSVVTGPERQAKNPQMPEGDWIRLRVADTGMGISAEKLPYIFEPFAKYKDRGEGLGLGLAEVRGIAEQHGGNVSVESEVSGGTRFDIFLPRMEATQRRVGSEELTPPGPGAEGATILVAEDDPVILSIMADGLGTRGYRVIQAANGREAINYYDRMGKDIQLVITDVVMPGIGGLEVLKQIREKNPAAKVMLMSGYAGVQDQHLQADWYVEWLEKPFDLETLMNAVKKALSGDQ